MESRVWTSGIHRRGRQTGGAQALPETRHQMQARLLAWCDQMEAELDLVRIQLSLMQDHLDANPEDLAS